MGGQRGPYGQVPFEPFDLEGQFRLQEVDSCMMVPLGRRNGNPKACPGRDCQSPVLPGVHPSSSEWSRGVDKDHVWPCLLRSLDVKEVGSHTKSLAGERHRDPCFWRMMENVLQGPNFSIEDTHTLKRFKTLFHKKGEHVLCHSGKEKYYF